MNADLILNKKAHVYLTNKFHYFGEIIEVDHSFITIRDDKTGLKIISKESIYGLEIEEGKK